MDVKQYWRDVEEEMKRLPDQSMYFITSLDNPEKGITAGRVMDIAQKKMAARRIVERTHRLSTPEEIEQFHADQKLAAERLADAEMARKGHLAMPKDLQDLVRLAAKGVQAEENVPKKKEK